jgi:xanthine dehydrogenase accessory factor
MHDISTNIERYRQDGKRIAIATVVQVYGSALRSLGAKMACTATGDIAGSVSGGCIEGAVYEAAQEVMATGQPTLLEYGVSNESAWGIGLTCGGTIQVWVEPLDPEGYLALKRCIDDATLVARATIIAGPQLGATSLVWPDGRMQGSQYPPGLTAQVRRFAADRLADQDPGRATFETDDGPVDMFVDVFAPPPRLVIVGAVHIAISLVTLARTLGFQTIVVDPRAAFATRERFPHADELIVEWPTSALARLKLDAATSLVVLAHDEKIDLPALQAAVASPARYIGILGARRTHAKRLPALRDRGVTDAQLARIHAPVGLRVGAVGPREIALSIMAEVVAVSHGRSSAQVGPLTPVSSP